MKKKIQKSNIKKHDSHSLFISSRIVLLTVFSLAVVLLSYLSFKQVLQFGFWRDDWGFLWAAQYKPDLPLAWTLHPATKYEDLLLFRFFGWNSVLWQGFGIFLRILVSLAISLMMWGLLRSKKIAILSGLFFSVSYVGLETVSWRSVHVVPIVITFISIGFYFISKYLEKKSIKYIALSTGFFCLSALSDPARAIPALPLVFILFLGTLWIQSELTSKNILKIIGAFLGMSLIVILSLKLNPEQTSVSDTFSLVRQILVDPHILKNFLGSIGNLLVGWVREISEVGSLSYYSHQNAFTALCVLVSLTIISVVTIAVYRSKTALIVLFFTIWIPIFYAPNWLFDKTLMVGGTHRYIMVSGVGLVAILAILIGKIKSRVVIVILAFAVMYFNYTTVQRILKTESTYRIHTISDKIWQKVDYDVPKNQLGGIFMYLGTDSIRGTLMDWSGTMPFGVKRGISRTEDFPIPTTDTSLIVKLLCHENVKRPSVSEWIRQKNRIPITQVYAWDVTNGKITNVSERERKLLMQEAEKINCDPLEQ